MTLYCQRVVVCLGLLLVFTSAAAARVEIDPTVTNGVEILSADWVSTEEEQLLVVRLRNQAAAVGQSVDLIGIVRNESGAARGGSAVHVAVEVPPGDVQTVAANPLESSLDSGDVVSLELASSFLDVIGGNR